MKEWETIEYMTFVEVRPLDDLDEHLLGDECPCNPRTEKVHAPMLTPWGIQMVECNPVIVHNSYDKREKLKVSDPLE